MKPIVRITAGLLAAVVTTASTAQEPFVATPMPYHPVNPPIMNELARRADAQLFAKVLEASSLVRNDIESPYVTFLVPEDATCSTNERIRLEGLINTNSAKSYVMDHAFNGSIAVLRDDADGSHRVLRVNYFPDRNTMDGRVTVDESHPFSLPLLSGKSVVLSLSNGVLHLGGASTLLQKDYGTIDGVAIFLDQCAVY